MSPECAESTTDLYCYETGIEDGVDTESAEPIFNLFCDEIEMEQGVVSKSADQDSDEGDTEPNMSTEIAEPSVNQHSGEKVTTQNVVTEFPESSLDQNSGHSDTKHNVSPKFAEPTDGENDTEPNESAIFVDHTIDQHSDDTEDNVSTGSPALIIDLPCSKSDNEEDEDESSIIEAMEVYTKMYHKRKEKMRKFSDSTGKNVPSSEDVLADESWPESVHNKVEQIKWWKVMNLIREELDLGIIKS